VRNIVQGLRLCRWVLSLEMVSAVVAAGLMASLAPAPSYGAASAPAQLSGVGEVTPGMAERRGGLGSTGGISLTPSKTEPYWACPEGPCEAIVDPPPVTVEVSGRARLALPDSKVELEGGGELGGYDPQNLQSAYDIPTTGGSSQTIALVDAYGYPTAEADLAKYRERYGLPPCTTGCFKKVNQSGEETNYPEANKSWETESALDIEMASAACPECHIMLVEATKATTADLVAAEDTAAALGATEISNSWDFTTENCPEGSCEEENAAFEHSAVFVTVAAGDQGYDRFQEGYEHPSWPATLPSVTSVGGTSLSKAENSRGWSEEVWFEPERPSGSGGGCAVSLPKPSWQSDSGCVGRTDNDVAAVAACKTPVSTYSTGRENAWANVCGTSVSAPLVAGIEAHASSYARSLPGADAFYHDPAALFDVTAGSNGECTPPSEDEYLCHAEVGYDGPTGNGTPDGALQLTGSPPSVATRPATAVTAKAATLNGKIDPQDSETKYHFEYGTTTSYGKDVPVPEGKLESGVTDQAISENVTGLVGKKTYHYRLAATNAEGTSYGQDGAFTTAAPVVKGVSPATGPEHGGTTVTITGTDFEGAGAVEFGSTPARAFKVESATKISALSPPGPGVVAVTVTSPAGTSKTSTTDEFTYSGVGPVLAWGYNDAGLGDGRDANSDVPVEVSGLSEAAAFAGDEDQSLALLANGELTAWGTNEFGDVGDGTHLRSTVPVRVCAAGEPTEKAACPDGPYLEEVTAIATGDLHSLALLKNGTVMAFGGNLVGELGSDTARSYIPVPVCTTIETPCKPEHYLKEVTAIAAGAYYSVALLKNGTVMAWGENNYGQLGDGSSTGPEKCDEKEACSRVPVSVSGLSEVTAIAAAGYHTLALLKNGTVKAWGYNGEAVLGDGKTETSDLPVSVCAAGEESPCASALSHVTSVAAGRRSSLALLEDGAVLSWGSNLDGQLGDGSLTGAAGCGTSTEPCNPTPVRVTGLSEAKAISADVKGNDNMALLKTGALMSWGDDSFGNLGDGSTTSSDVPVRVCAPYVENPCPTGPYLTGDVTAFAAGGEHEFASVKSAAVEVTSVNPAVGPKKGATKVTITGTDLSGATAVHFGAAEASDVKVVSPGEVTAVSPAGSETVAVTVKTPQGESPSGPSDQFTYETAPAVITGTGFATGTASAILDASVNPNGVTVSNCEFEYGESSAEGTKAACESLPGSGGNPVPVSASVRGLSANTLYHFKIVATNTDGTSRGAEQTFQTPAE
jgi:alpha-tubulin suppressor-like RCC1 family protein